MFKDITRPVQRQENGVFLVGIYQGTVGDVTGYPNVETSSLTPVGRADGYALQSVDVTHGETWLFIVIFEDQHWE